MSKRNQPQNNSNNPPPPPTSARAHRLQEKERELNRNNALCVSLIEELDSQIEKGLISPKVAEEIVKQFDFAYAEQLDVLKNQQNSTIEGTLEANLDIYRFFDDTADLEISNVTIKIMKPDQTTTNRVKQTDKLFIKALDPDQVQ